MTPLYVKDPLFSCYVENALVKQNQFKTMVPDLSPLPTFEGSRQLLPKPMWKGHDDVIRTYWRAWQIAFGNLRRPTPENGFVAPLIDTAFNGHLFMWDSVFILMFGRYGSRAFDFQRTLDDLYCKQHPDGFISREIDIADGQDAFHRHDPSSTGPNVMAWSEWEYYRNFVDRERLARVFPVLLAYHQWTRDYRTWPDGSYWSCGWACGMDNQPRVPEGYSPAHSPAHQAWVDACLQAILSARLLIAIGKELSMSVEDDDPAVVEARRHASRSANAPRPSDSSLKPLAQLQDEICQLENMVNERMWDESRSYYFDLHRDGQRGQCMTIGAYWALLAGIVPDARRDRFIAHLDDPRKFKRPHRVPSIPADDPGYAAHGNYWCGGVWPMTNYMVLRGLTRYGYDDLAYDIALSHVQNVTRVCEETGTLWENYAPESASKADPARPDFVGFSGIGPIAVLFEYVFGLRPDAPNQRLVWDVRQLEEHGIEGYPFGPNGRISLRCEARRDAREMPKVHVITNVPVTVELSWAGSRRILEFTGSASQR